MGRGYCMHIDGVKCQNCDPSGRWADPPTASWFERELTAMRSRVFDLEAAALKAKDELTRAQATNDLRVAENKSLSLELQEKSKRLAELEEALTNMDARRFKAEDEVRQLEVKLAGAQSDLKAAQARFDHLDDQTDGHVRGLKDEVERLNSALTHAAGCRMQLEAENDALTASNKQLQEELVQKSAKAATEPEWPLEGRAYYRLQVALSNTNTPPVDAKLALEVLQGVLELKKMGIK